MSVIADLQALEILDSRGRPTLKTMCTLVSGVSAAASVPSGASTGMAEALELRDNDPSRYRGLGCRKAVANVNSAIKDAFVRRNFASQMELDQALIALDGTPNKARLGANAILSVSVAFARACALEQQIPLYQYFARMINQPQMRLPRPMINLYSGGKHAGGQVAIQDIQIMPLLASSIDEILAMTYEVYQCAAQLAQKQFNMRLLRADEGGLAPEFSSTTAAFAAAVQAIERAGYRPGVDVALTVDVAASHFYEGGTYTLDSERLDGDQMVQRLSEWVTMYPIVSLEDGLAEEDWTHWQALRQKMPAIMIIGDDLLCTNPARIRTAVEKRAANSLLLKVNQIGTLSEAAEANRLARSVGWKVVISARSGETEDDWLADLAVGWAGDYIKIGSITQSERLAKYNRLLQIEQATHLPVT